MDTRFHRHQAAHVHVGRARRACAHAFRAPAARSSVGPAPPRTYISHNESRVQIARPRRRSPKCSQSPLGRVSRLRSPLARRWTVHGRAVCGASLKRLP